MAVKVDYDAQIRAERDKLARALAETEAKVKALEAAKERASATEAATGLLAWVQDETGELEPPSSADVRLLLTTLQDAGVRVPNIATKGKGSSIGSVGTRAPRLTMEEVEAALPSGEFKLVDLANALGREPATTRNYLVKLITQGKVGEVGDDPNHSGKGKPAKLYSRA